MVVAPLVTPGLALLLPTSRRRRSVPAPGGCCRGLAAQVAGLLPLWPWSRWSAALAGLGSCLRRRVADAACATPRLLVQWEAAPGMSQPDDRITALGTRAARHPRRPHVGARRAGDHLDQVANVNSAAWEVVSDDSSDR
jgi:hypothetical protein